MKMIKQLMTAGVVAGSLLAMPAMADKTLKQDVSFYGIGYQKTSFQNNDFDSDFEGLRLEAGRYFLPDFAVVTQIAGGGNDTVTYLGEEMKLDYKYSASLFVRGDWEVLQGLNVYGLLGATYARNSVEPKSSTSLNEYKNFSDTGLSAGFGVDWYFHEMLGVYGEYVIYNNDSDFEMSGLSIGLRTTF